MVTSSEGLEKIKRLVNYWMLKIEEEEFGDDEYDYPKYLLRTTLCNILSGLGKSDECLRTANLNIKEISGDVSFYLTQIKQKNCVLLNEKIRMLVLSALYKAESLLSLGDTPPNVIHDLLAKCDAYVDKYSMHDDKDITESIRSKKKSLLHYQTVKNSRVNSYEQLEEVRPSPVSTSGTKQMSPRTTYYTAGSSSQAPSKIQPRDSSAFKKGFVVKSKRGLSTEARVSDHSHGSTTRTVGPLDSYKPPRKSPAHVAVRRVSRDLGNTPNSRLSHDHKDRDHSYARKRMAPRLTHDPRYDDLELSYATMRQSHGAEGGKGNFFKPKLKNQPSRIDTDGSEPIVVQKDFLEDSERYEPEPEPEVEKPTTIGSPSFATKSSRPKSAVKVQSSRAKVLKKAWMGCSNWETI
jgi:hypothetical protein